jgi:monofunctional biosynthetic peptidoglycan transglycosylase
MKLVFFITIFALAGFSACSRVAALGVADPAALKKQYPVVHYHPLALALAPAQKKVRRSSPAPSVQDFTITLQSARPVGWVDLDEVSRAATDAIIVSEDWAFYQHHGYDPNQIREAIKENVEEGRSLRGASTITQQVARNVFLSQERSTLRKVKELVLAVRLEEVLGKRRILEVYLNIAEMGEGLFGIGAASQFYFHKPASELTAKEGAFLAMLLPSPKRYSQSFRQKRLTEYAQDTVDTILDKMERAHYLTEEQKEREKSRPLSFEVGEGLTALPDSGSPSPLPISE